MNIKNIVLDIGDVICEWNPSKLLAGIFDTEAEQQQALRDTIQQPDWVGLDRGTVNVADAIRNAQHRSSLDPNKIAEIYHATPRSLVPLKSTVEAIHEAHAAGVPLYVLSNMHVVSWDYLSLTFDFWECFNGLVISSHINLVKPEREIYQHLLEANNLVAGETVFVDDMPANIEAARAAGLQGVVLADRSRGGEVIRSLMS